MEDNVAEVKEKYRGPPPRKDLIPSPNKERDWKGSDWFNEMSTENMNGSQNDGVCDEKGTLASDFGIAPGLQGEYVDPHLKAQREYESNYAKLALQGGHKGLLSMDTDETDIVTTDDVGRRQRGCDNLSEYNKIALQGGHKDLLKIDADKCTPSKPKGKDQSTRTCGDWYSDNNGVPDNNNTPPPTQSVKPTSPESSTPPIRDQRRSNGNCIVPGGEEEAPRFGKKRFSNTSQRQEAPFATYY